MKRSKEMELEKYVLCSPPDTNFPLIITLKTLDKKHRLSGHKGWELFGHLLNNLPRNIYFDAKLMFEKRKVKQGRHFKSASLSYPGLLNTYIYVMYITNITPMISKLVDFDFTYNLFSFFIYILSYEVKLFFAK